MKRVQLDAATNTEPGVWLVILDPGEALPTDLPPRTVLIDAEAGKFYVVDSKGKLKG